MGIFNDLFFGTDSTGSTPKKKSKNGGWASFNDDYDDYYEQVHEDAMSGDLDAIDEMEDEFGDDWGGEF